MNTVIDANPISTTSIPINFNFAVTFIKLNQEGNLAYEYNPLRNLRLSEDKTIDEVDYKAGDLVDFVTDKLQFSLHNPVNIEIQPSYDGSMNLILNDDTNSPKLINTRFSCLEGNTYKIIERYNNNNSNIYREDDVLFKLDTSLYKRITKLPILTFKGLEEGGVNKVGNYHFYFKLSDSDGNETDFVAESGMISCFIGIQPDSIRGGTEDESSNKIIKMVLNDIDTAYDHVNVYYSRATSNSTGLLSTTHHKILREFPIKSTNSEITITGFDEVIDIPATDINMQYFVVDSVKAQTQCQNRLFLGNISKPEIPYKDLRDLALRFIPSISNNESVGYVDEEYKDNTGLYEYYNPVNLYYNLGY